MSSGPWTGDGKNAIVRRRFGKRKTKTRHAVKRSKRRKRRPENPTNPVSTRVLPDDGDDGGGGGGGDGDYRKRFSLVLRVRGCLSLPAGVGFPSFFFFPPRSLVADTDSTRSCAMSPAEISTPRAPHANRGTSRRSDGARAVAARVRASTTPQLLCVERRDFAGKTPRYSGD